MCPSGVRPEKRKSGAVMAGPLGPSLTWTRGCPDPDRPERVRARAVFKKAMMRGEIHQPWLCQGCGKPPRKGTFLDAHHTDYRKPLQVSWLCLWCHTWANRRTRLVYLIVYGLADWRYWPAIVKPAPDDSLAGRQAS